MPALNKVHSTTIVGINNLKYDVFNKLLLFVFVQIVFVFLKIIFAWQRNSILSLLVLLLAFCRTKISSHERTKKTGLDNVFT